MRQNILDDNFSESVNIIPPVVSVFNDIANDSDKLFVVAGNEQWKLNFVRVELSTTALVGNRLLGIEVYDANSNLIASFLSGATQAGSTTRSYNFMQGIFRETSFVNNQIQIAIAKDIWLPPAYSLRVYDTATIDAAGDDMTVAFQYEKYVV